MLKLTLSVDNVKSVYIFVKEITTNTMKTTFAKFKLTNQKDKGYNGLYKKLFAILEKDSIFIECAEEDSYFEGNDMIITTTWGTNESLPKGIERLN